MFLKNAKHGYHFSEVIGFWFRSKRIKIKKDTKECFFLFFAFLKVSKPLVKLIFDITASILISNQTKVDLVEDSAGVRVVYRAQFMQ